jgi:NADP-dependent 3-hydroxy acid dehydrogenase YdfG
MMNKLRGKNIVITGASQGLGRELALAFAREGAPDFRFQRGTVMPFEASATRSEKLPPGQTCSRSKRT